MSLSCLQEILSPLTHRRALPPPLTHGRALPTALAHRTSPLLTPNSPLQVYTPIWSAVPVMPASVFCFLFYRNFTFKKKACQLTKHHTPKLTKLKVSMFQGTSSIQLE